MKLEIIASGSKGNFYLLHGINETLMIECGIEFSKIEKALNYDFSRVDYCLLSHEHGDHAKSAKKISNSGISLFTAPKTLFKVTFTGKHEVEKTLETKEFKITRFDTEHDAVDPQGFLIESKTEFKKIVFITDSKFCKYDFSNGEIDCFMIEVNYQNSLLRENEELGLIAKARADRVRNSHFELDNAIAFLNASKSAKTKIVVPVHMSKENLDIDFVRERIEHKTGLRCVIGEKKIIIS